MSVTISIRNNEGFLRAYAPEFILWQIRPSEAKDYPDVSFAFVPFQLNMTNSNFREVFSGLDLSDDDCGSIDPVELLKKLQLVNLNKLSKEDEVEERPDGTVRFFGQGRTLDRVDYYLKNLRMIAEEAKLRGAMVEWA